MTDAMAIMTNRDKVVYTAVFPISVNMMNHNNSFISYPAVIAFLFKNFPSIFPIATRHLFVKGLNIPMINSASLGAIRPTASLSQSIWSNNKFRAARQTCSLNLFRSGLRAAYTRTKVLWFSGMLFGDKFFSTMNAYIGNDGFSSKNSTAFMPTCCMPIFMTFIYNKFNKANRTFFGYFIHKDILS